jgi:chromosome segregation ATPase
MLCFCKIKQFSFSFQRFNEQNIIATYQKNVIQELGHLKDSLNSKIVRKLPFHILLNQFKQIFFSQAELNAELELINLNREEHFKQLKTELEQFKQQHGKLVEQNQDLSEKLNQKSKENNCQLSSIEKLKQQLEQCKAEIIDIKAQHSQTVLAVKETNRANEAIITEMQKNIAALEAEKLKQNVAVQRCEEQIKSKDQEIAENNEKIQHLEKELANERDFTHDIHIPETEPQVAGNHKTKPSSAKIINVRKMMPNLRRQSTFTESSDTKDGMTDFESIDGRAHVEPVRKKVRASFSSFKLNELKV